MSTTDESRASSPAAEADENSKKRKAQIDEIEVDLKLPEPPSKKAKRLLKKGKSLPTKPKSDGESEGEDDDGLNLPKTGGEGGKDKKPKRSQYGVWVGNLSWNVTRVDLFKWLVESSGGAITEENITRVNLPTQKAKVRFPMKEGEEGNKMMNRGFAYIDFDTEAACVAAMALTETEMNGRKVLIKNSTSFEGRPSANASAIANGNGEGPTAATTTNGNGEATAKKPVSSKIYVGNLGFQVTEDDLRSHFDKCGEIDWLKVATFEDSGKCKGYGWVKFREGEAAESAVKGFVRLREEVETEEDFQDDKEKNDEDGEEKEEKKFKTRKWWVNRLFGRELKVDYAEDDQTRYKKRYGSGRGGAEGGRGGARGGRGGARGRGGDRGRGGRGGGRGGFESRPSRGEGEGFAEKKEAKPQYGEEGVASYLTGAVVQSQGKKTTFD